MAKKKKPDVLEEHVYTIPLRSAWIGSGRIMRSKKSVNAVRNFISRHMHAKGVKISPKLNHALWSSGAKKPPGKIRVKASIDAEGLASVKLPAEITLEEEKKKFLKKKGAGKGEPEKKPATGKEGKLDEPGENAKGGKPKKPEGEKEPSAEDIEKPGKEAAKGGYQEKSPEKEQEEAKHEEKK